MRPVWDEALGEQELRVLDPGPGRLDPRPDVLVVGGGAIGLAAAVMCRRAGLGRVQVIERDRCGAGPSGSAVGGISPAVHGVAHPQFVTMAWESLALHRELDAEWGGALGFRPMDWLIVSDERVAAETVELPGVEVVDGERAREIEPELGTVGGAIYIPGQAWVHPVRLAVALAARAGSIATGVEMKAIVSRGGRVVSVETTSGSIAPGAVVFATGTAPSGVAVVPHVIVKGHLLATAPGAARLKTAVASSILVLPLDDGRLIAGSTFHFDDDDPIVREEVISEIRVELARIFPAAADLAVSCAWCCFRPGTPDQMPVIDAVLGLANAWISVGHFRTGLMMAPAAGRAIASWISTGTRPGGLDAFGLARFG